MPGRNKGRLIAVEGIDQSGKRTQSLLLAKALSASGHPSTVISFPDYSTPLGRQLRSYLSGKIKVDYHVVHMLYAANKWEKVPELTLHLQLGRFIVTNRYTPSNLAYGSAHGLEFGWLFQLESDLPEADLVFVLDVSPKSSFERKRSSRDIHEGNLPYLRKVRETYRRLAKRYRWKMVNGEQDPETVHSILWDEVLAFLKRSA